jgi:ribosome modulation factor
MNFLDIIPLSNLYTPSEIKKIRMDDINRWTDDGRSARLAGIALNKCPPFRYEDMAIQWRIGWRDKDSDLNKFRKRS